MPTDDLVGWIEYLKLKERNEQARQIEALSIVAAKLFAKEEG